jgi:hypothetical protein
MDIIVASNIGMTNSHKCNHEKCKCNHKQEPSKLYLLVKINYTVDGKLGNNQMQISICNKQTLVNLAKQYYDNKRLQIIGMYQNMDISKVENAIQILTKREYLHIAEIDEDKVGKQLVDNKEVFLTSINNFN